MQAHVHTHTHTPVTQSQTYPIHTHTHTHSSCTQITWTYHSLTHTHTHTHTRKHRAVIGSSSAYDTRCYDITSLRKLHAAQCVFLTVNSLFVALLAFSFHNLLLGLASRLHTNTKVFLLYSWAKICCFNSNFIRYKLIVVLVQYFMCSDTNNSNSLIIIKENNSKFNTTVSKQRWFTDGNIHEVSKVVLFKDIWP